MCVYVCVILCMCYPQRTGDVRTGARAPFGPPRAALQTHTHTLTEVTEGLLQLVDIDVRLHLNELLHKGVAQGILGLHEKVVREERGREGGEERGER